MKRILIIAAIGIFTAVGFTSCNDDQQADPNSFKVRMTDSPGDYFQLNLQISSVDVYLQNQGWVNLSSQTQSVNVLSLTNGNEITLVNATNVSAGMYTKIRITFASQASIVLEAGGASINLSWTGSSQQTEIVINQEVSASAGANLLVDFNVAESITEVAGQYYILPVISIIHDENTGARGRVQGANNGNASVMIVNGDHNYSTYINAQGDFLLRGMEPGTYTVRIQASGNAEVHEVNNVVIADGQITQMGTIQL